MPRTTSTISTGPGFLVDPTHVMRSPGRQIDWASVPETYRQTPGVAPVTVTVGAGGAAAAATSVPVTALTGPIPSGTILDFTGSGKFALLTVAAAAGAVALTVEALPQALVAGDVANYAGVAGSGRKFLKAGTVVAVKGGTNGKVFPRAAALSGETAMGILESDALDDSSPFDKVAVTMAKTGFGVLSGADVYENLLPDAAGGPPKTLPAAYKTELNASGVGSFRWYVYEDVRS